MKFPDKFIWSIKDLIIEKGTPALLAPKKTEKTWKDNNAPLAKSSAVTATS